MDNTHVSAGNTLTLESGGNTNLKGAVATGKQVIANVGGDLNIESLQDTSKYHSKEQSISGSVTVGYGFSGSASASQQKIDSDFASVTEQSGIKAGDRGFQVNVRGNTDLKGAVIASTDKAVRDGVNSLTTATLTQSEIHNRAEYSASSIGIGGGYSYGGGGMMPVGGVGTNQQGQATTGGDKVPGSNVPTSGNWSATPPIVMGASGSGSSVTGSGISGGAIHITDGAKQQALTGKDAEQTVASINRGVSSERDSSNALKPIFNEQEIKAGFEIVGALQRETGTFLSNRAKESTDAQKELDKERAKPEDQWDAAKIAQLTQTLRDNETWEMGGTGRMVLTAVTAGVGGNVTGSSGAMLQSAAAYYLQGLATQEVKGIADLLDSEPARAALQGLVACAGAAVQSQSCGAASAGAAASVVLNNLLDSLNGDQAATLTPEKKQARENIVATIVAGAATALGGNAVAATVAAQIETENNAANFVKGTTERVKRASNSIGDILRKPKGQVTRKDIDAALAKLKEEASSGSLSHQESLNFSSLWMSVVERAAVENVMTPQEIVGSKEFMQAAIASMAFSSGGNTSIRLGGRATGPELPRTTGSRTAYSRSDGTADATTAPGLRDQINQRNLDAIAGQDARLAKAISGDGTSNRNFSIGTGTASDADRLGKIWVGDGARPMKDVPGGFVSADGSRTYRPPTEKDSPFAVTGVQANFQQFENGKMISNGHLNIHR
ncbi:hemagglutinin repeat-containing protein [Ralstonia solanacearum]|uniref:hemagglutinin repeat-containing protein n=1 Tax=Ralstonia solanacearum TaxID=305 RepID=UPI001FF9D42E|nr:hemagglutinin repeat-containing protein [Ralstonia solanacearum]